MFYQRVRPTKLSEVLGNHTTLEGLKALLLGAGKGTEVPHAFLFQGPTGCGKTTMARIMATELGAVEMDVVEYNAANTRGIDTVRELVQSAQFAPLMGSVRAFILDESHQLTGAAQEALLKAVEDCADYCYFFFCSTNPEQIIPTLRNRCAIYQVGTLRNSEMRTLLVAACTKLGILVPKKLVLDSIIAAAEGCPRTALVCLEQVWRLKPEEALDVVVSGAMQQKDFGDFCRELVSKRTGRWEAVRTFFAALERSDPERIRRGVLGYLRSCLAAEHDVELADRYATMIRLFEPPIFSSGEAGLLRAVFEASML